MNYQVPTTMIPLGNSFLDNSDSKAVGGKKCPYCTKKFVRAWTLGRHIEAQHVGNGRSHDQDDSENLSKDESSIAEESDSEEESSIEGSTDDGDSPLPESDIQRIRNLIAMAEVGDISLTKTTLTSLIDGKREKPKKKESESEDSMDYDDDPYQFRHLAISALREMLTAVKQKQMILTKNLYFDILNSMDLTGRAPDPEEEDPF